MVAAAARLTFPERAIPASSAGAAYLDQFSSRDRDWEPGFRQESRNIRKRNYHSRGQTFVVEGDQRQPLPRWFDALLQGFVDVRTLPPNWDSYRAKTIDPRLVDDAMNFIVDVLAPTTPAPRVVPLSSGGVQLEWRRNGVDLEIVFDVGDQPYFYYRNRESGEEFEHSLPEGAGQLDQIIVGLE